MVESGQGSHFEPGRLYKEEEQEGRTSAATNNAPGFGGHLCGKIEEKREHQAAETRNE